MAELITLNWVGGEHAFRLRLGEIRALQDNCNAGPEELLTRIQLHCYRVDDLNEIIRLGLIGAEEMKRQEATSFVMNLVEKHPIVAFKMTAHAILSAALLGITDDPVGEPQGVDETTAPESGVSPKSTDPEP